ncbi:MAG: MOSC domain-containing protein [Propylenella sp.]
MPTIAALYRYPVKGFSPEPLERAEIPAGGTMPFDRAFAVENGPSGFDPNAPAYYPKISFLMLMRNERVAEFATRFDETTGEFRILKGGELQVAGSLLTEAGRSRIEAWLAENFRRELRGPPRILSAPGHSFSDKAAKVLHLVNLESVRALSEGLGEPVDPLRFRPNIVIDGAPAWSELDWAEGTEVRLPGILLSMADRTSRCAATNVDPKTGRRDLQIPRALTTNFEHADFGIYLVASTSGAISVGDEATIAGDWGQDHELTETVS